MKIPASIPFGRIPDLRAHPDASLIALKPGKGSPGWYALIKTPVQRNMVIHPSFEKAIE